MWVGTVVVGVLAAMLNTGLLEVPGQLFDSSAAKDKLRRGPDFSVSTDVVRLDDEGRSAVTRGEFRPDAAERTMLARPNAVVPASFERLLRAKGAVNLEKVSVRVTLTGHRNQQIDIQDIRPLITARTTPLSGSLICVPAQGGAPTMNMQYDMDHPFPIARDVKFDESEDEGADGQSQAGLGPPFFSQRTITLHDHEQQVLLIRAVTEQHYVAFRLEVDYLLGTARKKTVIDDHGKPFEVSALNLKPRGGAPAYRSVYSMQEDFSVRRVSLPSPTGGMC